MTGPDGTYFATGLQAGRYRITAELSGFKKFNREDVSLVLGSTQTVEIRLEVGGLEEAVTVTDGSRTSRPDVVESRRERGIEGAAGSAVADAQLHRVRRDGARDPAQSQRGGVRLAQHQRSEQQPGHLRARRREQHRRQLCIGVGRAGANAARGGRRIPGPDQPVRRRIRSDDRRCRERDHETRDERVPRIGVRLPHELRHDGANDLREAVRGRKSRTPTSTSRAARSAGRSSRTRFTSSAATSATSWAQVSPMCFRPDRS